MWEGAGGQGGRDDLPPWAGEEGGSFYHLR